MCGRYGSNGRVLLCEHKALLSNHSLAKIKELLETLYEAMYVI
jgi:hypothetical protein